MRPIVAPLIALAMAAPAVAQDEPKAIVEYVAEAEEFQTLYSALEAAELAEVLQEGGPYTVFAPTDEAFAKLPKETVDGLLKDENKEQLQRILKHHVVPSEIPASKAKQADGQEVKTLLEGCPVAVSVRGDTVMIGKAKVTRADVRCSNGVIHVIDTVLTPPEQ